jgi:hypothetical protein
LSAPARIRKNAASICSLRNGAMKGLSIQPVRVNSEQDMHECAFVMFWRVHVRGLQDLAVIFQAKGQSRYDKF